MRQPNPKDIQKIRRPFYKYIRRLIYPTIQPTNPYIYIKEGKTHSINSPFMFYCSLSLRYLCILCSSTLCFHSLGEKGRSLLAWQKKNWIPNNTGMGTNDDDSKNKIKAFLETTFFLPLTLPMPCFIHFSPSFLSFLFTRTEVTNALKSFFSSLSLCPCHITPYANTMYVFSL